MAVIMLFWKVSSNILRLMLLGANAKDKQEEPSSTLQRDLPSVSHMLLTTSIAPAFRHSTFSTKDTLVPLWACACGTLENLTLRRLMHRRLVRRHSSSYLIHPIMVSICGRVFLKFVASKFPLHQSVTCH